MPDYPFADLELARRIEKTTAKSCSAFIQAHASVTPASGAAELERGGAHAFFDGARSPLTQTFCLGLFQETAEADLEAIERFFRERGAPTAHEVSPLAGIGVFDLLTKRGYRPVELTTLLYQPIVPRAGRQTRARVRLATRDEADLWSATAAQGWGDSDELKEFMRDVGRVSVATDSTAIFFAEIDGRPVGTGSLSMHDGVAHLTGASTIPSARNQGAQRALLDARLRYAADHGCDLATMGAAPGSASQRNAEREGFRIAYTRVKWALSAG